MTRAGSRARAWLAAVLLALVPGAAQAKTAMFLFYLSDFSGRMRFGETNVSYDPRHREVLVASLGTVHVFDQHGMEVYAFGSEEELGIIEQVVPFTGSEWLARSFSGGRPRLSHLNYRGELVGWLEPRGVPAELGGSFHMDRIAFRAGHIYAADFSRLTVLELDPSGAFVKGYRLLEALKLNAKQLPDAYLSGWDVSPSGEILFTINPLFTAYVLTPEGALRSFGTRGSRPGTFNQVGAIAADEKGTLYLTDLLRAVVMVFDHDFNFLMEFGYRGLEDSNLSRPYAIALGDDETVYVVQGGARGISAFKLLPQ